MVLLLPDLLRLQAQTGEDDARVQELYGQAKAAQSRNDLAGAISKYEEILRIAPRLGPAYNNLGALYFRQRDYQKAAATLEQ
jgi:tetratricopeptide (TPR) repeat protein